MAKLELVDVFSSVQSCRGINGIDGVNTGKWTTLLNLIEFARAQHCLVVPCLVACLSSSLILTLCNLNILCSRIPDHFQENWMKSAMVQLLRGCAPSES